MIRDLVITFGGPWLTIAATLVVVGVLFRILAWVCLVLGHYVAPQGNLPRISTFFAWSGYALMLAAFLMFMAPRTSSG
jgi:hypothetical protein